MSFYRTVLAAVAAFGLAGAVLAEDNAIQPAGDNNNQQMAQAADQNNANNPTNATEQTKVNINTATAKELMQVKGLNSAKAKSIVSYRKKHGEFKSLEDLKMVKGLKKMNDEDMKSLQDQLTVG